MRKLILSLVTATLSVFAVSADAQPMCRYPNGQIGPCGPITPVHQHRQRPGLIIAPQIQFGIAPMYSSVQSNGYRETSLIETDTTYRGSQFADPRGPAPVYEGAVREPVCTDPNAVFINKEVGCAKRVTDSAVMEKYRTPIANVCTGHRGDTPIELQDGSGGTAHYMCP